MDTFRKWLNKPKADDKSLLARFYHADRSLTAVASELDSFDGRAEPDRCSRLVSRLRQGQDKVLSITNQIMEELLGEDRDPRAFRAKFPEEVLQENLAGQLWFGAECLAAGSSIMNREQESKEMRPLAQAVTKSLGNVRNLLRDQCLRNNVPNSKTLHLDFNDSTTEQLYESLKIFDRLFAEFELRYVSAMVQVKTKHEYEMQEYICVLFSETLQRALTLGLLEQDKVDSFDPALMFSIPRLAIICGLVICPNGPLNMDMPADQLSEMFRPFRTILVKIRDLLRALNSKELHQLEKLLCTNEEINLKEALESSAERTDEKDKTDIRNNNNNTNTVMISEQLAPACSQSSPKEVVKMQTSDGLQADESFPTTSNIERKVNFHNGTEFSVYISSSSVSSSEVSTPSVSPTPSPTPSGSIASTEPSSASTSALSSPDWTDEENNRLVKELDIVSADCATGYLIPNTNLGNLLQPNEVPLTDNFIASEDDEFGSCNEQSPLEDNHNTLSHHDGIISGSSEPSCSHIFGLDSSEESEQLTIKASAKSLDSNDSILNSHYTKLEKSSSSGSSDVASVAQQRRHHNNYQHSYNTHRHHHHYSHQRHSSSASANSGGSSNSSPISQNVRNETRRPHRQHHSSHKTRSCKDDEMCQEGVGKTQETVHQSEASNGDTSSSLSDGEPNEVNLALREVGRMKFKSTENLLHRLFVCIAGVADQLQTNFASDLRQILRSVFLMNMSPTQLDITIPEKSKDSELFEFRASENDVIQESAGSNQSIYSAEEVNPELDNVFNSSSSGSSNSGVGGDGGDFTAEVRAGTATTGIRRGNTIDLGSVSTSKVINTRGNIGRSRSLGDQESSVLPSNPTSTSTRLLSSYVRGRHLSTSHRNTHMCDIKDNHSIGSNSPDNSSSSNSPVSDRSVNAQFSHNSHADSIAVSRSLHEDQNHLNEHNNDNRHNQHNQQYLHHRHHNYHHHHRHHQLNTAVANHNSNSNSNNNCNNNSNSNNSSNSSNINNNEIDRESRTQASSPPNQQTLHQSSLLRLSPPAWIPDDKAPRCMSCTTPFTAFRRRHHCRNCGGVFCGVCSSTSTPLPKYGLTKAVRVCRECFVHQLTATATATAAT